MSIPPSARQRVVGEQLRLLMKSPLPIHTGTDSVLMVTFVLRNNLAAAELCGWSTLALVVQALRYWLRWRIRSVDADALTARRWGVPIAILMTASGLLWGLFSLSIDRVEDPDMRSFIILIVTSLMTGGAVSFTAYLPACYGYLLAAALPITAALALRGTSAYLLMSCVGVAFLLILMVIARNSNRSITALIELTLENNTLVSDLRRARDAAEQASRIKSQFLANMSHELRTPLNAIIGFSDIVRSQLFGPLGNLRYEDYVSDIHQSGYHLLRLVNDILDISKLEAGAMEISDGVVDLQDIVVDSVNLLSTQAAARGISLSTDVPASLPRLRADEFRLKQVVLNLLSNAVKFSRRDGNVVLSACLSSSGDLIIAVRDSGIGMDGADIRIALQPFRQVENALSRSHDGTGLGLPLAKALIEKHGGTLHIASKRDVGTTVTLTLPASRLLPQEVTAAPVRVAG